jgi:hypothetical protein
MKPLPINTIPSYKWKIQYKLYGMCPSLDLERLFERDKESIVINIGILAFNIELTLHNPRSNE